MNLPSRPKLSGVHADDVRAQLRTPAQVGWHSDDVLLRVEELGHCTRVELTSLLCALAAGPVNVSALVEHFDCGQSAMSSRLGVLRDLGLVEFVQDGKAHYYALTDLVHVEPTNGSVDLLLGSAGRGQVILRLPNRTLGIPQTAELKAPAPSTRKPGVGAVNRRAAE